MMKTINLHIQKAQETPSRRNMKKTTLGNIIIKLLETIAKGISDSLFQWRKDSFFQHVMLNNKLSICKK